MLTCFFQETFGMVSNNFSTGYMNDYEGFCKEIDSIPDLNSEKIIEVIDRRNKEEALKKQLALVQETQLQLKEDTEEKVSIGAKMVDNLKKDLFPVISSKFNKLLLVIADEEAENQKLSPEKAEKAYLLFQETAKNQFNIGMQWDVTFSEVRNDLSEEYWEEAMKHHAFLLMFGISGQKQVFHDLFKAIVLSISDAESKQPAVVDQNTRPKSNKH